MATKKKSNTQEETVTASLSPIEELRAKNNINPAVFAGVKALKGWGEGKQVTEKEFLEAVKGFTQGPIKQKGVR